MERGAASALLVVAAVTAALLVAMSSLAYPSEDLLFAMASIGASFFLAYVLEAVWLTGKVERNIESENWLGFVTGLGFAGLSGIGIALAIAAHRAAGHGNLLDDLGFCWSTSSLLLLGALVALQPLLASDRYSKELDDPPGGGSTRSRVD